jgi:hypothetical protein
VDNLHRTLRERVLFTVVEGELTPTLQPAEEGYATPGMVAWRDRVVEKLPKYSTCITHSEFCEKYTGLKKKRYETAAANILLKGESCVDARVSGFLKPEKYVADAAPRLISPRSPEYLLETGCYIMPLEKSIYNAIATVQGWECIMKGYNLTDRARVIAEHWDHFVEPVAVGLDASKFDQHVSTQALQYEHSFYLKAYAGDRKLQRLLVGQLLNAVTCSCEDGLVKWTSRGGRMSGDMNTALGNCVLSAAMLIEWAAIQGVEIRAVIDGDDCVAFMEAKDEDRFLRGLREWYTRRGFRMKVEPTARQLQDIEFCQCHPVKFADGWRLVRNPIKAICQDHVWIQRGGITHEEVLAATGEGGVCLYGDCPVLGAYYRMLRGTNKLSRAARREMSQERNWLRYLTDERRDGEVTEEARISFALAFGIMPSHQILLEEYYRSFDLTGALANKQLTEFSLPDTTHFLEAQVPLFANFRH